MLPLPLDLRIKTTSLDEFITLVKRTYLDYSPWGEPIKVNDKIKNE